MSFISTAYAAGESVAGATTGHAAHHTPSMMPMLLILAVFVLFYVWMWRSQSKKRQGQQKVLDAIGKGDEVVTTGGISGRVTEVHEGNLTLQVGKDTHILVQKPAIATVLPKGTVKNHLDK